MSKTIVNFIKGIACLLLLTIACGCGKPKDLKFGLPTNIAVKKVSLSGVDLEVTMPIENPNGYEVKVSDGNLNLLANDQVVAHVIQLFPVTLPGKSNNSYPIGASINLLHPGEILNLISLFKGNTNLNLDGTVHVKALVFQKNVVVHQTAVQGYIKPFVDNLKLF